MWADRLIADKALDADGDLAAMLSFAARNKKPGGSRAV
jgi:hypothetical protein